MNAMKLETLSGRMLSVLRIVVGLLFMMHGAMKLFAFPVGMPPDGTTAVVGTQVWVGGVLEFYGGGLIVLGLFTRFVAFLLSGEMAVAYWQFHAPQGPWPILNQGVPAILYCFLFFYLFAAGGGAWSLDAYMAGKRAERKHDHRQQTHRHAAV